MATAFREAWPASSASPSESPVVPGEARAPKSLLRFLTCGSVDDGKSTLIGRLLYDSKILLEDQIQALEAESLRSNAVSGGLDFSLLVDGLAAEREQGITIDVAYRFFETEKRKFIVADTPGHVQYTRNMVTGASTADLAIILIDARKGVLSQTRRHSLLASLLGIPQLVLAINKMDMVDYSQERFDAIVADYQAFAERNGIGRFTAIPISAVEGGNVAKAAETMGWYDGPTLLEALENAPVGRGEEATRAFHMPVQWVNRPDQSFRGYAGTIGSGVVRAGDAVLLLPSGQQTRVERIVTYDGDLQEGSAGQAVTLTFATEVDCSRGDVIAAVDSPPAVVDRLEATLVWMSGEALIPGRSYWLKIGTRTVAASVAAVESVRDPETMDPAEGRPLEQNDIGLCRLLLDQGVPAALYGEDRRLGRFILIDRATNGTVAAGLIEGFPEEKVERGGEAKRIIRINGSSPAEIHDFAERTRQRLEARGRPSFILDAAVLRAGLCSDLPEGRAGEAETLRRAREVAKLLSRAGVTVLLALDVPEGDDLPTTSLHADDEDWGGDWVI